MFRAQSVARRESFNQHNASGSRNVLDRFKFWATGTASSDTIVYPYRGEMRVDGSESATVTSSRDAAISIQKSRSRNNKDGNRDIESGSTEPDEKAKRQVFTFWSQVRYSVFNSWLNVLLVFVPVGIALSQVHINPVIVFVINFVAIIPLAGTLSYATEQIALHVGETVGGLLSATFGNAVELIVGIIALRKGEIAIVQTSLVGSMLSNLLLVLGMCFFFGGINRKRQNFSGPMAQTAASLLALAIAALIIPTAFMNYADDPKSNIDDTTVATNETNVSRGTSVLLLIVYICYLVFQLRTHQDLYEETGKKVDKENLFSRRKSKEARAKSEQSEQEKRRNSMPGVVSIHDQLTKVAKQDDASESEQPTLRLPVAIFTLLWSTALVAACSEFLVSAIDGLVETSGMSRGFVGLILLPIVGNAVEHVTALTVACKDKMNLAISVAIGSAMQIALFVLPLIVVVGWICHENRMTLSFDAFNVLVLFVAVLLVNYLIFDGESHWLEGVMLMVLYIIIALVAWFYTDRPMAVSGHSSGG